MYSRASAFDEYSTQLQMVLEDPSEPPVPVSLDYLKAITDGFSPHRRIGRGGFGEVYKGVLGRDKFIAIKKLYAEHVVNDLNYQAELSSLMRIRHQNIVQLIGYCAETKLQVVPQNGEHVLAEVRERLLCFEYIGNGSLRRYVPVLRDTTPYCIEDMDLGWDRIYAITEGICKGLYFLHEECKLTHMDLKPENILMDDDMVPKITDFGLSRLKDAEKSQLLTQNVTGTLGYMPPEYLLEGKISHKTDIYSFGVIMCEIITGEKVPIGWNSNSPTSMEFTERACRRWMQIFEKTLNDASQKEIYIKQVKQLIDVALKCVHHDRTKRPSSSEILQVFIPNDPAERSSCELNSKHGQVIELLSVHPSQLDFSLLTDPKKLGPRSPCCLHLTNSTSKPVSFNLLPSETLKEHFLPQSGVVPPKCRYTLTITMHHQRNPPFGKDDFFTLESTKVRKEPIHIIDEGGHIARAREEGFKVHEVKIAAVYAQTESPIGLNLKSELAQRVSLNGQDIKFGLMVMPFDFKSYPPLGHSICVHPTEPWIFKEICWGRKYIIWDYHRLEKVQFRRCNIRKDHDEKYYYDDDDDDDGLPLPGPPKFIPQKSWILAKSEYSDPGYIYVHSYMSVQNFKGSKTYLVSRIKGFKAHDTSDVLFNVHPSRPYVLTSVISGDSSGRNMRTDGIKLWDGENGWCCVKTFNNMGLVARQPTFNPKDQEFFVTVSQHGVQVWNIDSPECKHTLPGTGTDHTTRFDFFTQGGKQYMIIAQGGHNCTIWDYHSGTLVKTLEGKDIPTACSHPELPVLISSNGREVSIWSSNTFSLLGVLNCGLGQVNGVAVVKGPGRIIIGHTDGIAFAEIGHMLESEAT